MKTLARFEPKTLTRRRFASIARLPLPGAPSSLRGREPLQPLDAVARHALIIGTTQHRWRPFSCLVSPALDLQGLHAVLTAPGIGGFEAPLPLCDQPAFHVAMELDAFYRDREPGDLLLLYVAGHVLIDESGAPFLITHTAGRGRWRSSIIDFNFLRELMDQSASQQQVVILDCALGSMGAAAPALGSQVALEAALGGRAVLSASSTIRYHLDEARVSGDASATSMSRRVVHGLRCGEADLDGDGRVSLADLAGYVAGSDAPGAEARAGLGARSSLVIARRAQAMPGELRAPVAHELRPTPPLGAGAPRRSWASHAASSVASWFGNRPWGAERFALTNGRASPPSRARRTPPHSEQ